MRCLREHPGVYRVGHRAPSVEATFLAAVWACGERRGAERPRRRAPLGPHQGTQRPPPEVTAPTKRRVQGVTTRRARSIEATTHRGDPDHHRPAHPRRPRGRPPPRCPGKSLSRGRGQARDNAKTGRGGAGKAAADQRREEAARRSARRRPGNPQRARASVPNAARTGRPPAPQDQQTRPRPPGRLPLARPPPDRRARQLPLPPLAPRVGAGPPARARGARPRRRVPPLHLRRRASRARASCSPSCARCCDSVAKGDRARTSSTKPRGASPPPRPVRG